MKTKSKAETKELSAVENYSDRILMRLSGTEEVKAKFLAIVRTLELTSLKDCTKESVLNAVCQIANLDLNPDPSLGQAYILPFKNTKENKTEATMILGYKGMISLGARAGMRGIQAFDVGENEQFEYSAGTSPYIDHKPLLAGRGKVVAAYAICKDRGGELKMAVVGADDIARIKQKSKQPGSYDDPSKAGEFWKKAAIRRLFKSFPHVNGNLMDSLSADQELPQEKELNAPPEVDAETGEVVKQ